MDGYYRKSRDAEKADQIDHICILSFHKHPKIVKSHCSKGTGSSVAAVDTRPLPGVVMWIVSQTSDKPHRPLSCQAPDARAAVTKPMFDDASKLFTSRSFILPIGGPY